MYTPTAVLLLNGLKPAHRLQTVADKYDTLAFLLTSVNQAAPKRQSQATQRCVDARRLPKLNSKNPLMFTYPFLVPLRLLGG